MTTPNTANGQTQLPDPQTALQTLFGNISSEVFFGKLASAGIVPQNEKEANDLIELAGRLRLMEQNQPPVKSASPYSNLITELDTVLAQNGMDGGIKQAAAREHQVAINQAAYRLMQQPEIYASVMSVKVAQASAMQPQA